MLGDVAVANLDKAMVRGFVADIRRLGKSQGTVDGCVKVLRLVLGFAVDAGAIKSNPAARLRMDRQQHMEMHFLSESDVVLLASKMREPMYEAMILFAAWTGLRAGEIEALRVKRVNLVAGRAEVAENLGAHALTAARRRPASSLALGPAPPAAAGRRGDYEPPAKRSPSPVASCGLSYFVLKNSGGQGPYCP